VPHSAYSEWQQCHALNAAGGLQMLEWQDNVMSGWLGRDGAGKWAAPTCAGTVPRQNGKSLGLVEACANYGMVVLREQVLYTSHLQKTSTETFEDMASFFDQRALRKYVKDIKTALGREQIILTNGARIKFLARTRNGGRGQHGDLLIFDEALELDADSQASFLPAISASKNPQTIYVSTPPTARSIGAVLRTIRARALAGQSDRTAWFEWSVDEIGDVRDKSRWYATNPSLGVLIQQSTIEGEVEQMDADTFARERLGWWENNVAKIESVIDEGDWNKCRIDNPKREGIVSYAVKFSGDGQRGVLAACHRPTDAGQKPFVYIVDDRSMSGGLGWFVDVLTSKAHEASQITIDGKSYSQALRERLMGEADPRTSRLLKKTLVTPTTTDITTACSSLLDAVRSCTLTHYGQPALDAAATKTTRRPIGGNGGWGFKSTDEGDATLIEAAALAYWGAMTTKRKPGRKAVVRC
jgi:hypothetical protein